MGKAFHNQCPSSEAPCNREEANLKTAKTGPPVGVHLRSNWWKMAEAFETALFPPPAIRAPTPGRGIMEFSTKGSGSGPVSVQLPACASTC